ncbi:MAG TPA: nucleotide exchange factor GrpE [Blastocatellia bacterium]|jgi:molecular chaperone GrpE
MEPLSTDRFIEERDTTQQVLSLERELQRARELYLRTLADFDNYRKRVERERASAARAGKRGLILSMLDVLDSFDRAIEQMKGADPALIEGLEAIRRKTAGVLEAEGVRPFESKGEMFDPELHEAVARVDTNEHPPGAIVDEFRRGYRWDGEVLRHSEVSVAR